MLLQMTGHENRIPTRKSHGPLWAISLFVGLAEIAMVTGVTKTDEGIQITLTVFAVVFPLLIFAFFASVLWFKPQVLYGPTEYRSGTEASEYAQAMKPQPSTQRVDRAMTARPTRSPDETEEVLGEASSANTGPTDKSMESAKSKTSPLVEMVLAFQQGDNEAATAEYDKMQASESDPVKRVRNEGFYWNLRFEHAADGTALSRLRELAEQHADQRSVLLSLLASCHLFVKDYKKARAGYERAMQASTDETERAHRAVSVARCDRNVGQAKRGLHHLSRLLAESSTDPTRRVLYEGIAEMEEARNEPKMRALVLDKVSEYKPIDVSARFDAAYAQAEVGFDRIAILNYHRIQSIRAKDTIALNNLAILLAQAQLPILAISNYRGASKVKDTLAMANLAFRYLEAGFEAEAKELIDAARKEDDVAPAVGTALAALAERRETEEKEYRGILESAEEEQRFLRCFVDAFYVPVNGGSVFEGEWRDSHGMTITIEQANTDIKASWVEGSMEHKLSGQAHNRGAHVVLKRRSVQATTLLSGLSDSDANGYSYVTKDKQCLHIMTVEGDTISFLEFKRDRSSHSG